MTYVHIVDGSPQKVNRKYFKEAFPGTSLPDTLTDDLMLSYGFFPVTKTTPPVGDVVTEADPVEIGGVWTQQWSVRDFTPEEVEQNTQKQILSVEAVTNKLFFKLCKYLVEENVVDPQDARLADLKDKYLEWKTLTGN